MKQKPVDHSHNDDPAIVISALRELVRPFEDFLVSQEGKSPGFTFNTRSLYKGKPLFFAGAQAHKSYVSFYLFPVYMFPDLLADMSPELKARMQGKSCFNFKGVDARLFEELALLTRRGFERLRREKIL